MRRSLVAALLAGALASSAARAEPEAAERAGRSPLVSALLYLPSRLLDLGDLLRFGIDVGPGAGFDLQVTMLLQAKLMARTSLGVGYQGLRHLPVKAAVDASAALGPLGGSPSGGLGWYRSASDLRVELHLLLVGFHVAVDPVEWADLPLGVVGLDPAGDDL
jgi:hypothetical protein